MPKEAFRDMWQTIQLGKSWKGEVKNLKKNRDFYWVMAYISPEYDNNGNLMDHWKTVSNEYYYEVVKKFNLLDSTL